MTGIGRDDYERWLEQELREAAPEARALFVDEVARRVRAQRFRLRPSRARLGFALAFSALMIVALGVLGAPGYVAHAATAIVKTATTTFTGGNSSTTGGPGVATGSSGTDQYAVANGICNRTGSQTSPWALVVVTAADLDAHAARGDIIPAPPWGCPPAPSKGHAPNATTTSIVGPATVRVFKPASFTVALNSPGGTTPQGTVSCFDNLHRFAAAIVVDNTGHATCTTSFPSAAAHSITAVFKTDDVNKWASSAGNVIDIDVTNVTPQFVVASNSTPAPFGAGVTFTANVAPAPDPGASVPTGSVQFLDGTTPLGSTPVTSGTATFTTSTLAVGSHTIKASYSGDGAYGAADATASQVVQAVATRFVVTTDRSTAGKSFSATVKAEDALGNIATTYGGTVHLTASDPRAVLPADYTFAPADNGSHVFSVTLKNGGPGTLTVTDTTTSSINGTVSLVVDPDSAAALDVGASGSATAGTALTTTVTARDASGNTATGYTGTVHFTSSDAQAALPANYTFAAADKGKHTFLAITLKTAGTRTLTATDTASATLTGATTVSVAPATAAQVIVAAPASATAGSAVSASVTATDQFGNTSIDYRGTVHLASSDASAVLPADYQFTGNDRGTHTFASQLTLKSAGAQTLSVRDTGSSVSGTSAAISVAAAAADHVVVSAPGAAIAGSPVSATATAKDAFGNTATGYTGAVHLTSSDAQASLPADYTFAAADAGSHTFSGVVLKTAGSKTITASGTAGASAGTSADVVVSPAAADHLAVSTPSSAAAGTTVSATVTATDAFGNTATGYTGTVHLASTDPRAVLPADFTLNSGAQTVTGIVLKTAGSQAVSATDTMTETITGNTAVSVGSAAADHLALSAPALATAGTPVSVTVTAKDVYGNTATGYVGGIRFSATDPKASPGAGLPADYTFAVADNGTHIFTGAVALTTAGSRTVAATDTVLHTIAGTTPTITVGPAAASTITVSAPASVTAGDTFSAALTAKDAYGNTATGFTGGIHFTSTDAQAALPVDYTFVASDNAGHTFTGIRLNTAGTQSLVAHGAGSITGGASVAVAEPAAALPQQPVKPKPVAPPAGPQTSASMTAEPTKAGSVTVASSSTTSSSGGSGAPSTPLTVAWAPSTFGNAPAHVSATVDAPVKTVGVQFAAGSTVLQIDAVTDSGQAITTLNDALDITIPNAPADVAPMYQRGDSPWVVIPRLSGTTLPAGQPDGWYRDGSTIHILTRHLTRFGLATALDVKWGTRRRVHLRWAQRIVVYGAPSVDSTATYTLRRGKKVFGTWTRTLPAGKGAPANLWLTGKNVVPGLYRLTITIQAGPQRWTQVVAIRYLR